MPPRTFSSLNAIKFDPQRLIAAARRRALQMALVAFAILAATVWHTFTAAPEYTAVASVMLDTRTEHVTDATAVLSSLAPDSGIIDSEVEVLKSRQLAGRVVDALELQRDAEFNAKLREPTGLSKVVSQIKSFGRPPSALKPRVSSDALEARLTRDAVIDSVLGHQIVRRVGLSYVINVGFRASQPAKAAVITNKYAELYLLEQLEAKFEATRKANEWLSGRIGEIQQRVERADAAVAQYRINNNLLSSSGATLTEQEISNFNLQAVNARTQQAEAEAKLNTARAQMAQGSNGGDVGEALTSDVIRELRAQRATASAKVAGLRSRYGPLYPDLQKAEQEVREIDTSIQAEIQRIVSNLEAQANVARQRSLALSSSLNSARGTLASNNRAGVALSELERRAAAEHAVYESLLNRFKQTTGTEGSLEADGRIVSAAAIPTSPSSPKLSLNLAIGLLAALAGAMATLVFSEALDTGIGTGDDVEAKLGQTCLGSIPLLSSITTEKGVAPAAFVVKRPLSGFAEAFRALRTVVQYGRVDAAPGVLMLTSALPGEGKTTTAVCLARASAQAGHSVIVVDCDLRRRNVNRVFGFEAEVGLVEVVTGRATLDEAIRPDDITTTDVLPLAKAEFTPQDLFGSEKMKQLLEELRRRYTLVILDTAPALAVSDTRILAGRADAVLFLTRWRKTPAKAVEKALATIVSGGANVIGIALTQVDVKKQANSGYGDAGYYYSAYKSYYGG